MHNNKKGLIEHLSECKDCHKGKSSPFYFDLRNQKIMVITACPSMQAEYKPLTSIRFFRKLCIALFGDSNLGTQYLSEICNGNIYWTHYYKCYNPVINDYNELPDKCANIYLEDEIRLLKPEVIIVFGDEIRECVCAKINKVTDVTPICKPFPQTGSESEYDDVRNILKKYISFMNKTDKFICGKYAYDHDDSIGADVHMSFELKGFKQLINKQLDVTAKSIEEAWYEKIILPNMKMYQNTISTYSFIENQINVFLQDFIYKTGNYTFLRSVRTSSAVKKPNFTEVSKKLSKNVMQSLQDYMFYKQVTDMHQYNEYLSKFDTLRRIRNCIVHNNGFLKDDTIDLKNKLDCFDGISILGNTIFIDEIMNTTFIDMAEKITEIINKIQ